MGEYAEMMLDGTCCQQCGDFLDADAMGFPQFCGACQPTEPARRSRRKRRRRARRQRKEA